MAEFGSAEELIEASRKAYAEGYRRMDAYSPFPIHELDEALGIPPTVLPWIVFVGGIMGGLGGYTLEYWTQAVAYPVNIGGKPFHSWPAYVPVWFECTVLGAAISALIAMLLMNGLPQPYHPVFNIERFVDHAQRDKFFLCIESSDPRFKVEEIRQFFGKVNATEVWEVPN
jgi:hypothetical protein